MENYEIDDKTLALFNVKKLRDEQKTIINHTLTSPHDLIAIMSTGGGKTLCFTLTSFILKGITIVIYPLLSLISDQKKRFDSSPIKAFVLIGGQTNKQRERIFENLKKEDTVVILTNPETLIQSKVLKILKNHKISLLVIDEAHTVIEWGETFRNSFLKLSSVIGELSPNKVLSFTATLTKEAEEKLKRYIYSNRKVDVIRFSSNRKNISYKACFTLSRQKSVMDILFSSPRPALVFTQTRESTKDFASYISEHSDFKTYYYHAGCSKEHKKMTEKAFDESNDGVLVATCAYGMGVDKKNIRTVIHVTPPQKASAYIQEAGRAGRDGEDATSYVILKNEDTLSEGETAKIFSNQKECIRKNLLKSMGEDYNEDNCNCSYCLKENTRAVGEEELINLIKASNGYFTIKSLVRFLKEKDDNMEGMERILYSNHLFKDWGEVSIKEAINTLITNYTITLCGEHIYLSPLNKIELIKKRMYNITYDFKQKHIPKLIWEKCCSLFNRQKD